MSELQNMVAKSIQILKDFQPENENYYVCYSDGGSGKCPDKCHSLMMN